MTYALPALLLLAAAPDPEVTRVYDTVFVSTTTTDPRLLDASAADRVAARLGAIPAAGRGRCYLHRPGIDGHQYCFELSDHPPYRYTVSTAQHGNGARFFLSAYRQELDPAYRDDATNFIPMPPKSSGEFWRRTFINMGWGAQYVYTDNPYSERLWFAVVFAYAVEAAHDAVILAGPFVGRTTRDKVGIPLVGLASLLLWKVTLNGLLLRSHLVEYNSFAESGYRSPRWIDFDE